MDWALLISVALMALAGIPHCAVMCGPACTAIAGSSSHAWTHATVALHAGRVLSYGVAGAVVAGGVSLLGALSTTQPLLRPLWTLVHAAALGLGLWLLLTGKQPAWLERLGRDALQGKVGAARADGVQVVQWRRPARALGAGALWAAWPCGLLQSAIVVAALANTAASGFVIMATFGAVTALGLFAGPVLWLRLAGGRSANAAGAVWAVRVAGLALAAASAWAMGHDLFMKIYDYCVS